MSISWFDIKCLSGFVHDVFGQLTIHTHGSLKSLEFQPKLNINDIATKYNLTQLYLNQLNGKCTNLPNFKHRTRWDF